MDFKLSDLIYHIPKFISKNDCQKLIEYYENNIDKTSHEHSFDINNNAIKPSLFKSLELSEETEEYYIIFSATEKVINLYCKYLNEQKLFFPTFKNHFAYSHKQRLLKYEKGAYMHMHTDLSIFTQGSITFNLNDNYDGGDFSFFNGHYKVKLGCGDALIFPAGLHWIHGVDKIISGCRYSTNSFLQPVPYWVEKKTIEYVKDLMISNNLLIVDEKGFQKLPNNSKNKYNID